jgi:hypothetical protein
MLACFFTTRECERVTRRAARCFDREDDQQSRCRYIIFTALLKGEGLTKGEIQ